MRVRERLTSATAELMQRHGVAGTGIAEILDASGVTRRSIYLNFPGGKAELVAAATRWSGEEMTALLRECVAQDDPIAAFTAVWGKMLTDTDFEGGCPVLAAACSRDEAPEASTVASDVFADWSAVLAERLVAEGIEGAVAQSLSTTIVAAFEGAVVMSRARRSTVPLEQVAVHIAELVELKRPPKRRRRS